MSAHDDVLLVHSLVGAHQISDFFIKFLKLNILSISWATFWEKRLKQSVKSTAVAFFLLILLPATMPLAIPFANIYIIGTKEDSIGNELFKPFLRFKF